MDGVAIAGIKTARRMRASLDWAQGSIARDQLRELERRFAGVPADTVKIVVAHHPLLQPEGVMLKPMERVKHADRALETFARLGVRLVLSGTSTCPTSASTSRSARFARACRPAAAGAAAPLLVAQASSTISTRLRANPTPTTSSMWFRAHHHRRAGVARRQLATRETASAES